MRIKLDENMPQALADLLGSAKHDVSTVLEEDLSGAEDLNVLTRATQENRLLMTFDLDFGDIRSYPIGSHAGIVVFRLRDQRWNALEVPVKRLLTAGLLDGLNQGLAVVNELRIRIRRV